MKISVCMATYNGMPFIIEQFFSIISQLDDDDEIIISDDGSNDGTKEFLLSLRDPRVKVIHHDKQNLIKNFENAIENSRGDLIILSDQDDIWLENKVKIVRNYMRSHDNIGVVVHDCEVIDGNGKVIDESFFHLNKSRRGILNNLIHNSYLGCCITFRKEMKKYILPFPDDIPMHDWWIGCVGEVFSRTSFLKNILIQYRRHGNNTSVTTKRSTNCFAKKLMMRIVMVKNLIGRILKILIYDNFYDNL